MTETPAVEIVPAGTGPAGEVATHEIPLHEQWAADWLLSKHNRNTRDAYRRDIRAWFAWCIALDLPVFAARRMHVNLYREHLGTGRADPTGRGRVYQPATIARKLTAVSSFYTHVAQDEHGPIAANPARHVTRPELDDESTTVGLNRVEAAAVIATADAVGPRESAIVRMFLTTGIRVSELCGASTRAMTVERGHRIIVVVRKRGRRQKIVLSPATAAAVDRYLDGRAGPIFLGDTGRQITRHQVAELVADIAKRAGVTDGGRRKITPHSLRHSATTLALDAGATLRDVQTLMGHIDPRTTNRYDRARHDLDRSAVHVLASVLDGPTP